ncbi:MAG: V-type ATPase subunit [Lachnospiraceae bacterium]|jgi:V/A-type H+-transporting ATPase subunit C|nr:V-type ATPase subunit [Lachnospiraceae bacterium]
MGRILAYSALVTKVRAMQAKLLTAKDYEALTNSRSVVEAISYLKSTASYEDIINQLDASLYHRRHVERILIESLYDDYTRIYRFSGLEQRRILNTYMKRYEVDLINYCLRIVSNHYDMEFDMDYKKPFFERYSDIDINAVLTSTNVDELIANLKNTDYHDILQKIRESGNDSLFEYDLAMVLQHANEVWHRRRRKMKGREFQAFTDEVGSQMDLMNLQWIYRAKKHYHLLPPDIFSLVIPVQYHIKAEEFKALVESPSLEEFNTLLLNTYYAKKFKYQSGDNLEHLMQTCLRHLYLTQRRLNPYSISSVQTYFFLKEQEVYNIITILECIRYGLTQREIYGYLGGSLQ